MSFGELQKHSKMTKLVMKDSIPLFVLINKAHEVFNLLIHLMTFISLLVPSLATAIISLVHRILCIGFNICTAIDILV